MQKNNYLEPITCSQLYVFKYIIKYSYLIEIN